MIPGPATNVSLSVVDLDVLDETRDWIGRMDERLCRQGQRRNADMQARGSGTGRADRLCFPQDPLSDQVLFYLLSLILCEWAVLMILAPQPIRRRFRWLGPPRPFP
jgi:hypothetical protein